jgi:hypothetical protein
MSEEWKDYSGWYVRHPMFLREPPNEQSEIVAHHRGLRFLRAPWAFCPTKEEALGRVRELLAEQKEQAERDIAALSSQDTTYHFPESMVEEWREKCRKSQEIAVRGLALCG